MYSTFFIGDFLMINKKGMSQTNYTFVGANKLENRWEISLQSSIVNGYAGGSAIIKWIAAIEDELRVSGNMKGFMIIDGFNKEKIKETAIKALKFKEIEKDMIRVDFII